MEYLYADDGRCKYEDYVAANIVNEIHDKYGSLFVGCFFIFLDTLILFDIIKLLIICNQHNGMTHIKTKIIRIF